MKRRIAVVFAILFLLVSFSYGKAIYAASASVAFSTSKGEYAVGDSFMVTLTAESSVGISGFQTYVAYDPNVLELTDVGSHVQGGDGLVLISDLSGRDAVRQYHMKFKAKQEASTEIYVSDKVYMYAGNNSREEMSVSQNTLPLEIKAKTVKYVVENQGLSSLVVSEGTLSPAFDPAITNYAITVGNDVENVLIEAKAKLKADQVEIAGNTNLKEGDNKAKILVTNSQGQKKMYQILIHRNTEEEDSLQAETLAEETTAPEENPNKLDLEEEEGFIHIKSNVDFVCIPLPDIQLIPNGYEQKVISFEGKEMIVYGKEGDSDLDYVLVYGRIGNGIAKFYQYDRVGQFLSRWDETTQTEQTAEPVTESKTKVPWYLWVIATLITLCFILLSCYTGEKKKRLEWMTELEEEDAEKELSKRNGKNS